MHVQMHSRGAATAAAAAAGGGVDSDSSNGAPPLRNRPMILPSGAAFETSEEIVIDRFAGDRQPKNQLSIFDQPSISDAIAASETLEEFEERERQIARQLDDEAFQQASNNSKTTLTMKLANTRQKHPVLPPNSSESPFDYLGSSSTSGGFEPPTSPALMMNFSGYVVPASGGSFEAPARAASGQPLVSGRSCNSPAAVSATKIASAMSGSLAFAGNVSPTVLWRSSPSTDAVYGTYIQSQMAPAQNCYGESTNKWPAATAATDKATPFPITADLREILSHVAAYSPQNIEIEPILQPFLLDYIPAVGDVDPFIKIPRPDGKNQLLGLTVLDEPAEQQSDSAWLDLQLYQRARRTADAPVRALSRADRNKQQIERWIASTREARKSRPPDRLRQPAGDGTPSVDVEALMQEWPEQLEQLLNRETLPDASLDIPLADYVDVCLALADIPRRDGRRVTALHALFSVYLEFRSSQHFRSLAANNRNNNHNNTKNNMYRNESSFYGRVIRTAQPGDRASAPKRLSGSSYSASSRPASRSQNRLELL